mmetsp:Transcript_116677/g.330043  ORF Transcript_116677/g.330043 Transcript_116677/m.330043 type:complete len:127 (+) Transcript_116677:1892-2272(+)
MGVRAAGDSVSALTTSSSISLQGESLGKDGDREPMPVTKRPNCAKRGFGRTGGVAAIVGRAAGKGSPPLHLAGSPLSLQRLAVDKGDGERIGTDPAGNEPAERAAKGDAPADRAASGGGVEDPTSA